MPTNRRRSIDIAFTRARLAIFIDGCFWHGCPKHANQPRTNSEWWKWKLEGNRHRDRDTDRGLHLAGWTVLRFWEHEDPVGVAAEIELTWRRLIEETEATTPD